MLELVKEELRITHNKLNATISRHIEAAKAEMELKGVKEVDTEDPLIQGCIVTYVQMRMTDDLKEQEMYYKGWETQMDGLRKSKRYGGDLNE